MSGARIEGVEALGFEDEGHSHFLRLGAAGETGLFGPVDRIVATFALARLRPLLEGRPLPAPGAVRELLAGAHRHAGTGLAAVAIGAVDCALWDLRGKLAGQPVFELLGGGRREVPAYASLLGHELEGEAAPARAAAALAEGYAGVKWALRGAAGSDAGLAAAARVREAIGSGAALMLDALCGWQPAEAEARCREAETLGLRWLEDPLPARDLVGTARLAARTAVPIATGEHAYSAAEAGALLRFAEPAALLVDAGWCGLSDARQVAAACAGAGVPLCPHGAGLVPGLHLAAAYPDSVPMVEYHVTLEPRRQHWFAQPLEPREGRLVPPAAPGLGIALRPERQGAPATRDPGELWRRR